MSLEKPFSSRFGRLTNTNLGLDVLTSIEPSAHYQIINYLIICRALFQVCNYLSKQSKNALVNEKNQGIICLCIWSSKHKTYNRAKTTLSIQNFTGSLTSQKRPTSSDELVLTMSVASHPSLQLLLTNHVYQGPFTNYVSN